MAKRKRLKDADLSAMIAKAISQAEHLSDGKMSRERTSVDSYYHGELPLPLHKGDSKYVSRDVFDAVDSMRATVLEAFAANTRIVTFRPEKGETSEQARQASDYTRHQFFKKNPGEDLMYEALTDGLKARYSVAKVIYEEDTKETDYDFEALTSDELAVQVADYKVWDFKEVHVDDQGLHTGTFTVTTKTKCVKVEVLQPEDLLVANNAPSLKGAKFVIHRQQKPRSFFTKNYDEALVDKLKFSTEPVDYEKFNRFEAIGQMHGAGDALDETQEDATFYEAYVLSDLDGSGVPKLWKVCYCSGEILDREEIERLPLVAFVPLPIPHTFFGENYGLSVIPMQNARTVLIRQIINHSLVTNNPRQQVMTGTLLNPSELLENRLGGIVNVKRLDGIAPIPQAQLNPYIFSLIQMIDEDKEEVTGISKLSQGMNKDAISTQNSQGMVEQLISASQQRTKIVARRFGLFIRDLFELIYSTAVDHIDEDEYADITGEYVPVKPMEWKHRTAANIELTLGYGEQEAQAMKWTQIDAAFSQDPSVLPLYPIEKRFEVLTRILHLKGIEDVSSILTNPKELPPPQPDPGQMMQMEQMKAQIALTNAQAQAMMKKADTDLLKAQAEMLRAQAEAKSKGIGSKLDAAALDNDIFVSHEELKLAAQAAKQTAVYNP